MASNTIIRNKQNERLVATSAGGDPRTTHAAETKGPFRSFSPVLVAQTATGSHEHAYAWPLPSRCGRAGDVRGGH
jgi:hypothetical protein